MEIMRSRCNEQRESANVRTARNAVDKCERFRVMSTTLNEILHTSFLEKPDDILNCECPRENEAAQISTSRIVLIEEGLSND